MQNDIPGKMQSWRVARALDKLTPVRDVVRIATLPVWIVEEVSGDRYFVLVIHHAIFDGWSMQVVIDTLFRAYEGADVPVLPPYAGFIKYTSELDVEAATAYWRTQLEDAQRASFPPISTTGESGKNESRAMTKSIAFPRSTQTSITKATILHGLGDGPGPILRDRRYLLRHHSLGPTCAGEWARPYGRAGGSHSAGARPARQGKAGIRLLEDVQAQASDMVAFEQFGLQNISGSAPLLRRRATSPACSFSSLCRVGLLKALQSSKALTLRSTAPMRPSKAISPTPSWSRDTCMRTGST